MATTPRSRTRRFETLQRRSDDPSRTKTLRNKYARNLRGGFSRINTVIREAVGERDIFGLSRDALASQPRDFTFARDDQKVDRFVEWLEKAQRDDVLTVIDRNENTYIKSAYRRGVKNAQQDLRRQGVDVGGEFGDVFNQPIHQEKAQALFTRNFRELRGVTEAVDQAVSRELADALLEGANPRETARRITDRVDSIGKTRASTLARTEILNSHNEAFLTRTEQVLGEDAEVEVLAEILTAGDACDICEPRHGETMTLKEARADGPPWHPNCKCTYRSSFRNR